VDTGGFVSVTELVAAEAEEVEITVGDGELKDELLDGAVEVTVAPSDVEQPTNRAKAAPIMSNPNGLDSPLSVIWDPLPAPRPAITRQQANAFEPQIHIPPRYPLVVTERDLRQPDRGCPHVKRL
jgi:hypothetical protein